MIRNSPVLLLDEPTTGLDAESTQRVLEPMRRLMHGRTTIIISHNLLTVTDADQILFLDEGMITGAGTHQQLLGQHPGYTRLYRLHHPDHPDHPAAAAAAVMPPGRAPTDPSANSPTTRVPAVRPQWATPDTASATTRFGRILPTRPVKALGRANPTPPPTGNATAHDPTPATNKLPTVTPATHDDRAPTTGRHHTAAYSPP
jgi:ABC-type glutathione transport system ATPase component